MTFAKAGSLQSALNGKSQNARLIHDPEHSLSEDRYILLGISSSSRLLIVCHCYQKNGQVIRLISARLANSREHQEYREFLL
jgi:uncharacterized DUF497 family protein